MAISDYTALVEQRKSFPVGNLNHDCLFLSLTCIQRIIIGNQAFASEVVA